MVEQVIEAVGPWWFVLAIATAILGVGRWSRVVVHDDFPPTMWVRQKWADFTTKRNLPSWGKLLFCWWCFTPWLMLVCIGWFALTFIHPAFAWSWWLLFGWGALSYVASIIMARDEPGA